MFFKLGNVPKHKGSGFGIRWLMAHRCWEGDECLIWPLGCNERGYGFISFNGKIRKAHRMMCEVAHGPPPTPLHHAAHSCGRGNAGCVNPRHLSWKTPSENQQDMVKHGTARKPGTPRYKLTPEKVATIRTLKGTKSQSEIGKMFGVNREIISRILSGKAWSHIQ